MDLLREKYGSSSSGCRRDLDGLEDVDMYCRSMSLKNQRDAGGGRWGDHLPWKRGLGPEPR